MHEFIRIENLRKAIEELTWLQNHVCVWDEAITQEEELSLIAIVALANEVSNRLHYKRTMNTLNQ